MQPLHNTHSTAVNMEQRRVQEQMARARELRLKREAATHLKLVPKAAAPKPAKIARTKPGRPDLGYVHPKAEMVLELIELYGPLTGREIAEMHELHFGEAIRPAAMWFGWGELIAVGYIGWTGDTSVNNESGLENRTYDVVANLSEAQMATNEAERQARRTAHGLQ
jgi:hypothetical protein